MSSSGGKSAGSSPAAQFLELSEEPGWSRNLDGEGTWMEKEPGTIELEPGWSRNLEPGTWVELS